MSQQKEKGLQVRWCDDCGFRSEPEKIAGKPAYNTWNSKLFIAGWSSRPRKNVEKTTVVNSWRHRCPNCSRPDKKGRLK